MNEHEHLKEGRRNNENKEYTIGTRIYNSYADVDWLRELYVDVVKTSKERNAEVQRQTVNQIRERKYNKR